MFQLFADIEPDSFQLVIHFHFIFRNRIVINKEVLEFTINQLALLDSNNEKTLSQTQKLAIAAEKICNSKCIASTYSPDHVWVIVTRTYTKYKNNKKDPSTMNGMIKCALKS